jgi:diguanylate cyclase (GGDEF)-like protein/PAS domain S-box-containing protein
MVQRSWAQDEISFLGSAAKQISLALMKIKLLEEKKATAESLRVSEDKHRLITQMRQGVAVHEIILDQAGKAVDYRFLEVNESYERLTGLKRENIIGKTALEIQPDMEREQINKYGQVAMTGEPLQYESYVKELGKYFEVVAYSPQPFQVAVILSDISERKRAEEALRESETREKQNNSLLHSILESPQGMIIFALDSNLCYTAFTAAHKNAMIAIWGVEIEIGLNMLDVISDPLDREKARINFEASLRGKHLIIIEEYGDPAMNRTFYENRYSPIQDESGVISGVAVFVTDITERKQAENALKEEYNFRTAIENSMQAGVAAIDMAGKQISVNRYFTKMVGWTSEELIGKSAPFAYWPPDEIENINDAFQQTLQGKASEAGFELKFIRKNGELFEVLVNLSALEDSKHEIIGWLAVVVDISERKRMEAALRLNQSMLARTERIAQIGSWEWDVATDNVTWSEEMFRIFQRNPADGAPSFAGHPELYYPDDMQRLKQAVEAAISNGTPYELELRAIRKDGMARVCLIRGFVEMSPGNRATRLFGSLQDITERKQADEAMRESQEMLSKFIQYSPIYSYIHAVTPSECFVLQSSDNYKELIGISGSDMVGKTMSELFPPEFAAKICADDWAVVTNGEVVTLDEELNGRSYITIKFPIVQGDKTLLAGFTIDITEQKLAEEKLNLLNLELEKLALTDYLTNLFNRRYFMLRGAEEIKRAHRNSQPLALLMLDIDEFKKVNDSHGHEAGDLALQQVAAVMKSSLREIDLLGRLGGEEFAALLPNTSLEEAVLSAERVRQTIANTPFVVAGQVLSKPMTISIGVATITDEMSGVNDLLRNADAALYRAKESGRNCVVVWQSSPDSPPP